jgi:hypothetical protein
MQVEPTPQPDAAGLHEASIPASSVLLSTALVSPRPSSAAASLSGRQMQVSSSAWKPAEQGQLSHLLRQPAVTTAKPTDAKTMAGSIVIA